jgi:hypothetical protein
MTKKLKFLFSLLLASCLFLPLSQCTSKSEGGVGTPDKVVVKNQYAFQSATEISSWLNSVALLAPFFLLAVSYKSRHRIKFAWALLLLCFASIYAIFTTTVLSHKILIGGYLGYLSAISLILLTLFELWFEWSRKRSG